MVRPYNKTKNKPPLGGGLEGLWISRVVFFIEKNTIPSSTFTP